MEYIQINLLVKKDIVEKIQRITDMRNAQSLMFKKDRRYNSIEDFFIGCAIYYIEQIENQSISAGIDDLGKPYRLKNHFKEILDKKGWTQQMLADKTGINKSNISVALSNQSQFSLDYFLRVWIALGCPPLNKCLSRIEE